MNQQSPPAVGTVLVCDYVGRRTEAPVSCLGLDAHGYTVRNLIAAPYSRALSAAAYAEDLDRRHGPFDGAVLAVLAYCASAPIGRELVASMAGQGHRVPLVTFDPEPSTLASIHEQYLSAADKLGAVLSLPPDARVPESVLDPAMLRERPGEALRLLHQGLLTLGERAVELGTDGPEAAQEDAEAIAGFYLDWFAHLIAAHNTAPGARDGTVWQIISQEYPSPTSWQGGDATETVRIPATRDDLMRHPATTAAVLDILRRESSHVHDR